MRLGRAYILAVAVGVLSGCADEVEDLFSTEPAFCHISPVTAVQPLREALTGPGILCTITFEPTQYICTRADGTSAPMNRTDEEAYGHPVYRAGFIVGTPSLPDAKTSQFYYVCYELACPSCYDNQLLTRPMTLRTDETAECSTCGRTYSMLYGGSQVGGPEGVKKMKRYHCTYTPAYDTFVVQN